MYVKVKGWLLDKWEDAKKWWKTMGLSESDVKIGQDIYNNHVYNQPGVKVKISQSAKESNELKGSDFAKDGDDAIGGLDVKIKLVNSGFMENVMKLIVSQPIDTNNYLKFTDRLLQMSIKKESSLFTKYNNGNVINSILAKKLRNKVSAVKNALKERQAKEALSGTLDLFFQNIVYCGIDSEKYYIIDDIGLNEAVDCLFKNRNNFISRIMNHERACTKVLENTLRKAQQYQSGDTEYKNTHDNNLDDEYEYIDSVDDHEDVVKNGSTLYTYTASTVTKKGKITVDTLSTQIRFNSDIVKKSIEAYRRYLSNNIAMVKRVMSNERIKKAINAIKEGEKPATAYSKLNESYDPYWDNDYSYGYGGMESYMWS